MISSDAGIGGSGSSERIGAEFDYRRLLNADADIARIVVLVLDADDTSIAYGLAALQELSRLGVVKPFLALRVTADGIAEQRLIVDGVAVAADFFDTLKRAGKTDRLDAVTIFSEELSHSDGERLVEATTELVHDLRRLAPEKVAVRDHRLSVGNYDSPTDAAFGGAPDTKLVVIPEDRQHPLAMAQPLHSRDSQAFGLHVATEVASLCGLWEAVDGAALDSLQPAAAGIGIHLVFLVRSFVRIALLPLPSVHAQTETLPVARGAMRTPVPFAMTEQAARLLHPKELKCRSIVPLPNAADATRRGFWTGLGRRMLSDLRRFPARLRGQGRSEVESVFDEMADVLRAETPWLFDPVGDHGSDAPGQRLMLARAPGPVEVLAPEIWADLVQDVLGVADNGEHARRIREDASGDGRHVLVGREHLAALPEGCSGDLEALHRQLTASLPDQDEGTPQADVGTPADDDSTASDETQPGDGSAGDSTQAAEDTAEDEKPQSILQRLSDEFTAQKAEADLALSRCRDRLAEVVPRLRDRSIIDIELSPAVPYLLAYGILIGVLCWTVLPRWDLLRVDIVANSWWLSRVFVALTAAVLLALLMLNLPRKAERLQLRLVVGTTAVLGAASWLLLAPQEVIDLLEAEAGGWAVFVLVAALIVTVAVCVHFMVRSRRTTSALRVSAALVVGYLLVVAVSLLNDGSFTDGIGLLDSADYRKIAATTVVALCLVLSSIAVVSLHHYRRDLELERLREECKALEAWHKDALVQAERLGSVLPHWLGTALALHRIIRMPYGAPDAPSGSGAASGSTGAALKLAAAGGDDAALRSVLMKFVCCDLQLTDRGQENFNRLVQENLARPGWLHAQYRHAAEAYRASLQSPQTATLGSRSWPDACAYPYPDNEDLIRTADGDRWPFVQRLYAGDYDPILRESLDAFVFGAGLDKLFDEVESCWVVAGTHSNETAAAVFADMAEGLDSEVPPSILDPVARDLPDSLAMRSFLWWPQRLESPSGVEPGSFSRSLHMDGFVMHQAVRVDLSDPIPLSALAGATESPTARADPVAPAADEDNHESDSDLPELLL
ncbi:MAG: hypothetical protein OXE79_07770 [Acidimicrobiaceae bacterium]|nr:hypothetical protein [Acidimicrobiaceae bacterium]MCY4280889.1 hypothetical protein [Acidimicrobiaceae bacterium]MCY4293471.1 hypothetical protein [Acidimicrobiaceae bacterium]